MEYILPFFLWFLKVKIWQRKARCWFRDANSTWAGLVAEVLTCNVNSNLNWMGYELIYDNRFRGSFGIKWNFFFWRNNMEQNVKLIKNYRFFFFWPLNRVNGPSTWRQITFCSLHINAAVQRTLSMIDGIWNVHKSRMPADNSKDLTLVREEKTFFEYCLSFQCILKDITEYK